MSRKNQYLKRTFLRIKAIISPGLLPVARLVKRMMQLPVLCKLIPILVFFYTIAVRYIWRPTKRYARLTRRFLVKHEVFYWIFTWGICIVLGFIILSKEPIGILTTALGLMFCAFIAWKLEVGIIAVLILEATIFHPHILPRPIEFGGQGPRVTELLIFFMVIIVLFRSLADRKRTIFKSPMTLPLMLFVASVLLSLLVVFIDYRTVPQGQFPWRTVYNSARPLFGYLFFFVVAFGIRKEAQVATILRVLVWVVSIVSFMVVIQYIIGKNGHSIFPGGAYGPGFVRTLDYNEPDIIRTTPPGMAPMLLLFLILISQAAFTSRHVWGVRDFAASVMGMGLLFSFFRSFWASTILGVVIIAMFVPARARMRMLAGGMITIILVVSISTIFGHLAPGRTGTEFTKVLSNRFISIFQPETLQTGSLQDRVREARYAMDQIKQNPLFGIGVGRPIKYQQITRPGSYTKFIVPVPFIHNSYLELWMVYGLLGLVSYLWLAIVFLIRSFQLFRISRDAVWKAFGIAIFAGYTGFLIRSVTQMHILHDNSQLVTIPLVWGLVEVLHRLHREKEMEICNA